MSTESIVTKPEDHARVIVLFGVKGSGKDTVGDLLKERYLFSKDSFAAPLKKMVSEAFEFTEEDLYGPSSGREHQYEEYPMGDECLRCGSPLFQTAGAPQGKELSCVQPDCGMQYPLFINPRIALQTLGTEWGRRLFKHIWVDRARVRLRKHIQRNHETLRNNPHLIAPGKSIEDIDYRFVFTDGRFVSEHERCVKLGWTTVLLLRKLDESTETHASEAELKLIPRSSFNYILDNRAPLEALPGLVTEMMTLLGYTR